MPLSSARACASSAADTGVAVVDRGEICELTDDDIAHEVSSSLIILRSARNESILANCACRRQIASAADARVGAADNFCELTQAQVAECFLGKTKQFLVILQVFLHAGLLDISLMYRCHSGYTFIIERASR